MCGPWHPGYFLLSPFSRPQNCRETLILNGIAGESGQTGEGHTGDRVPGAGAGSIRGQSRVQRAPRR